MGVAGELRNRMRVQFTWMPRSLSLVGATARMALTGRVNRARTLTYVRSVGLGSTPLLALVALPLCTMVVMGQGASTTSSKILSTAAIGLILHNIAPLVVTGIVLVRWPSSEATRTALKTVSEGWAEDGLARPQILRDETAPAILGTALAMVCLWAIHLLLIVAGGVIATVVALGAPLFQLFLRIATSMSLLSLAAGFVFTGLCGSVIAAVAVQAGLEARSVEDVPLAARHGFIRALMVAGVLGATMTLAGGHWP